MDVETKIGKRRQVRGGGRGWPVSGETPAAGGSPDTGNRRKDGTRKVFSAAERAALLDQYAAFRGRQADFCAAHGVSAGSLMNWRSRVASGGQAALVPLRTRKAAKHAEARAASRRRVSSAEEKRAAVEAYGQGGGTQRVLARLLGVSRRSLQYWLSRYRADGPQSLEPRPTGRPKGAGRKASSPVVSEAIVDVARRHPFFGLRRIRSHLRRFAGLTATPQQVRRVLQEHAVEREPRPKPPRAHELPRRFERAAPNELWQSDITSLWLAKGSRHVYLTVFLDDASRYVVSWGLSTRQTSELVIDALLCGIAARGKPNEVLTDQGRQYFAWRGKSRFQKLLKREGIAHVVSRAHHPETLGKCERLWKTVKAELWDRVSPRDLQEARVRLAHFFQHYNHQRPHQGIGDAVPADRFFGVASEVRAALEQTLARNELHLALAEKPRRPVFLVGQIDGQSVSLHGEGGRLVINTPQGGRQEISAEDLGGARVAEHEEVSHEGEAHGRHGGGAGQGAGGCESAGHASAGSESGGAAAAPPADRQEAHTLLRTEADAGGGAGALGGGDGGGTNGGAQAGDGDPGELAGEGDARGGGGAGGSETAALLAAEPGGAVGDAGRSAAPAAAEKLRGGAGAPGQPSGGGPLAAEVGERGAEAAAPAGGGTQ